MASNQPSWLVELDALKSETKDNGGGGGGGDDGAMAASAPKGMGAATHLKKSRNQEILDGLDQEMKLLHWHKLANEAALKAALIRTKKLKEVDRSADREEAKRERSQWMQQVVEEEQAKPLKVNEEFVRKYEEHERKEEVKLEAEVKRHITSLKTLKSTLKKKEEERQRNLIYRKKKQALQESFERGDLEAMLNGGLSMSSTSAQQTSASEMFSVKHSAVTERTASIQTGKQVHGTLSKVINSLDKLVDLEKRIARLETDVGPDSPKGASHGCRFWGA